MDLLCAAACPYVDKDDGVLNLTYLLAEGEETVVGDMIRIEMTDGSFLEREIKVINPIFAGDYSCVSKTIEQGAAEGKYRESGRKLSAVGPCVATFVVANVPYREVQTGENVSRENKETGENIHIFIGNFKEFNSSGTESVFDHLEAEPYQYQKEIAEYLFNGKSGAVCPTKVKDVVTGRYTGYTKEIYTDSDYTWTTDLAYHVMAYNLRLPEFFEYHILVKLGLAPCGNGKPEKYAAYYEYEKLSRSEFIMISGYPIERKDEVLNYMKSFQKYACTTQCVTDAATGFYIEGLTDDCYSDGTYCWYESDIYHFRHYDIKLNNNFINHVLAGSQDTAKND